MNKDIKNFLETNDNEEQTGEIRWKTSKGDDNFFNECAKQLDLLGVKLVLDIACGDGDFVKICNKSYDIKAYGITPGVEGDDFFYKGTFESILNNQKLLNDTKFDCITIHNTLHGKRWKDDELNELLSFMKQHSKYIVISKPKQNPDVELDGLNEIHKFSGSHSKRSVVHRIYEVTE
jgi:SAM-dependent methyltransferase|tara:strand:- start:172 stop:702 length:531 start_codon:yes stop_codon:yes gene_type:complete